MFFSPDKINTMSEQDVREEIIAKIVEKLGYRYASTFYCERERALVHPYAQIGHRSKRDVPVGAADYLCGIDGKRGSFSIEAKRGNVSIGKSDIIQAHSYAAHFEIGAKFFAICNGHTFQIFETAGGSVRKPLIVVSNQDLERNFEKIASLLSPINLERYSITEYEISQPIADGYGSALNIKKGWVSYENVEYYIPGQPPGSFENLLRLTGKLASFKESMKAVLNRRQPIIAGVIKRDSRGKIFAHAEFDSADESMAHNLSAMGLVEFTFLTDSERLSTQAEEPTAFESMSEKDIPKGTVIVDVINRQVEAMGLDSKMSLYFRCLAYLIDGGAAGSFTSSTLLSCWANGVKQLEIDCIVKGNFTLSFG